MSPLLDFVVTYLDQRYFSRPYPVNPRAGHYMLPKQRLKPYVPHEKVPLIPGSVYRRQGGLAAVLRMVAMARFLPTTLSQQHDTLINHAMLLMMFIIANQESDAIGEDINQFVSEALSALNDSSVMVDFFNFLATSPLLRTTDEVIAFRRFSEEMADDSSNRKRLVLEIISRVFLLHQAAQHATLTERAVLLEKFELQNNADIFEKTEVIFLLTGEQYFSQASKKVLPRLALLQVVNTQKNMCERLLLLAHKVNRKDANLIAIVLNQAAILGETVFVKRLHDIESLYEKIESLEAGSALKQKYQLLLERYLARHGIVKDTSTTVLIKTIDVKGPLSNGRAPWIDFISGLMDPEHDRPELRSQNRRLSGTSRLAIDAQGNPFYEGVSTHPDKRRPKLDPDTKKAYTRHQAMTLANPSLGYYPAVFRLTGDVLRPMIGIVTPLSEVLIQRIMWYNPRGTFSRYYDAATPEKAADNAQLFLDRHINFLTPEDLQAEGIVENEDRINEIHARIKKLSLLSTTQVSIFNNTLESCLLAQLCAFDIQYRLSQPFSNRKISFYYGGEYTETAQAITIIEAQKLPAFSGYLCALDFYKKREAFDRKNYADNVLTAAYRLLIMINATFAASFIVAVLGDQNVLSPFFLINKQNEKLAFDKFKNDFIAISVISPSLFWVVLNSFQTEAHAVFLIRQVAIILEKKQEGDIASYFLGALKNDAIYTGKFLLEWRGLIPFFIKTYDDFIHLMQILQKSRLCDLESKSVIDCCLPLFNKIDFTPTQLISLLSAYLLDEYRPCVFTVMGARLKTCIELADSSTNWRAFVALFGAERINLLLNFVIQAQETLSQTFVLEAIKHALKHKIQAIVRDHDRTLSAETPMKAIASSKKELEQYQIILLYRFLNKLDEKSGMEEVRALLVSLENDCSNLVMNFNKNSWSLFRATGLLQPHLAEYKQLLRMVRSRECVL